MELTSFIKVFSIIFSIVLGITAIFSFAIGLRGILTKKPFMFSNRWFLVNIAVACIPVILIPFLLLPISNFNALNFIHWVNFFLIGFILLAMWYLLKGYVAFAVTDASFREALLAVLEKLQLPYEESLSVIRLTSIGADLQVVVQSWMGTGIVKTKQRAHRSVLKEIVNGMNEYFRVSSVSTNMISSVFFVVMGVFEVLFIIGLSFFWKYILNLIG